MVVKTQAGWIEDALVLLPASLALMKSPTRLKVKQATRVFA